MNFAFALRTELMLNVRLFSADIDLVNFTMLLPMVETGAEVGPVTLLFEGTSNFKAFASLRKSERSKARKRWGSLGKKPALRWRRRKTSFGSSSWVDGPPWATILETLRATMSMRVLAAQRSPAQILLPGCS